MRPLLLSLLALGFYGLTALYAEPTTQEQCIAQKGQWDPVKGVGHVAGCNLPAKSAGKVCRDTSECPESPCVDLKCYPYRHYRGCGITIKEGGVRRQICAD
jgi:hypothetical protein